MWGSAEWYEWFEVVVMWFVVGWKRHIVQRALWIACHVLYIFLLFEENATVQCTTASVLDTLAILGHRQISMEGTRRCKVMMIAVIWSLNLSHVHAAQAWLLGTGALVRRPDQILTRVHNQTLAAAPALRLKFWTLAQTQGRTEVAAIQEWTYSFNIQHVDDAFEEFYVYETSHWWQLVVFAYKTHCR
jgi:hypothetical protein